MECKVDVAGTRCTFDDVVLDVRFYILFERIDFEDGPAVFSMVSVYPVTWEEKSLTQ